MIRDKDSKRKGLNDENISFKHYKVIVKILHEEKVEHQDLEIFTTGLKQLLEMRRIHNRAFDLGYQSMLQTTRNN
jgi:hypothetical protein